MSSLRGRRKKSPKLLLTHGGRGIYSKKGKTMESQDLDQQTLGSENSFGRERAGPVQQIPDKENIRGGELGFTKRGDTATSASPEKGGT